MSLISVRSLTNALNVLEKPSHVSYSAGTSTSERSETSRFRFRYIGDIDIDHF